MRMKIAMDANSGRPSRRIARQWTYFSLTLLALSLLSPRPVVASSDDCLGCHAPKEEVVDVAHQVDPAKFAASIHGQAGLECTDCHEGNFDEVPHEGVVVPHCTNCHEEAGEQFKSSAHEQIVLKEGENSPFGENPCAACHGVHDVLPPDNPQSRVFYRNIPATCGRCHGDTKIIQLTGVNANPPAQYETSVHGLDLSDPNKKPAVCSSCHGYHDIRLAKDPKSRINPFNIPSTCGQCHKEEAQTYLGSVHGVASQRGVTLAPTCTTCHGMHTIAPVTQKAGGNKTSRRLVRTTCPACHQSTALISRFNIAAARVSTYEASYHGLVSRRGGTNVADCASCHGIHNIYDSSDPRSTVAPQNLEATCGKCHPGAGEKFVKQPVHLLESKTSAKATNITIWVKRVYWVLLIGVLGGMLLHNAVILFFYIRKNWRKQKGEENRRRFNRSEIWQHSLFLIAFVLLALSGFMLAYPDHWWARAMTALGVGETARRAIHRVSAVVMVAVSLYHIYWIAFTSYGRGELKRIAPRLRDARELLQNMRFHLGKSEQQAAFAKFDYPAKMEYWALVWGTVVMALTGAILWFPVVATSVFPSWIVDVATVIHLFEAWLATLAILIFHFFFVIFHPEVYPLSFAMLRGTMPSRLAEHHHPAWRKEDDAPAPTGE